MSEIMRGTSTPSSSVEPQEFGSPVGRKNRRLGYYMQARMSTPLITPRGITYPKPSVMESQVIDIFRGFSSLGIPCLAADKVSSAL